MERRVYYLLSSVEKAKVVSDTLLLNRIEIGRMHFMAKEGTSLGDLPEATYLQKSDLRRSVPLGLVAGGVLGVVIGYVCHAMFDVELGGFMILALFLGALLGGWGASMIGITTENPHLKKFSDAIADGKILLMLEIPVSRVDEIEMKIREVAPQARYEGLDPTYPSFP